MPTTSCAAIPASSAPTSNGIARATPAVDTCRARRVPARRSACRPERRPARAGGARAARVRVRCRSPDGRRSLASAGGVRTSCRSLPAHRPSSSAERTRVRTVEHHSAPVVTLVLRSTAAPAPIRPGAKAWRRITADMADEGTGAMSALDVSDALARLGADYDVEVGSDATIFTLTTLSRFAERGATLLSDIVTRPALRDADFDRVQAAARSIGCGSSRICAAGDGGACVPATAVRHASLRPPGDRQPDVAREMLLLEGVAQSSATRTDPTRCDARRRRADDARGARQRGGDRHSVGGPSASDTAGRPTRRRRRCRPPDRPCCASGDRAARRRRAVRAAHRSSLGRPRHARLFGAARHERGHGRPVREPHQSEAARGEGIHVRRAHRLRLAARAWRRSRCRRACTRRATAEAIRDSLAELEANPRHRARPPRVSWRWPRRR